MDDNRDLDSELGDLVRKLEHLTPNPELKTDLAKLLWKYGHRISVLEAQVAYLAASWTNSRRITVGRSPISVAPDDTSDRRPPRVCG